MPQTLKEELANLLDSLDAPKKEKSELHNAAEHLRQKNTTIPSTQQGRKEIHDFLRLLFFDTPAGPKISSDDNLKKSLDFLKKVDRMTNTPSPKKSK